MDEAEIALSTYCMVHAYVTRASPHDDWEVTRSGPPYNANLHAAAIRRCIDRGHFDQLELLLRRNGYMYDERTAEERARHRALAQQWGSYSERVTQIVSQSDES